MPIEKLGSSSLVSSIIQREGKLHCSLTGRKLWSQVKKSLRHLIYARACVNKDFVHKSSVALIWGKHVRYVIMKFNPKIEIEFSLFSYFFLGGKCCFTTQKWTKGLKIFGWRDGWYAKIQLSNVLPKVTYILVYFSFSSLTFRLSSIVFPFYNKFGFGFLHNICFFILIFLGKSWETEIFSKMAFNCRLLFQLERSSPVGLP